MTPEQLTEAVRKHAKTVLQPSVAQAIIEELAHEQLVRQVPVQHPDDEAVDRFAAAMKAKLSKARNAGRSGWQDPAWPVEAIGDNLREHVEKGDPRDVANYCMFLFERGERIPQAAQGAMLAAAPQPKEKP